MLIRQFVFTFCFLLLAIPSAGFAAFPDDLEGVVFIEEGNVPGLTAAMNAMAVTAQLQINITGAHPAGGQNVILTSSKTNVWPGILGCCNANAWLFVEIGNIWYAGTWEFLRVGQSVKSTLAMRGAGHLRFPPLNRFLPANGETYGFMVSGITRNGLGSLNIRERSNVAFFKFGVGPVDASEIGGVGESSNPILNPVIDLLLDD